MDDRRMAQQTPRTGTELPIENGEIYRYGLDRNRAELDDIDDSFQSSWGVLAVGPPQPPAAAEFGRLRFGSLPEPRNEGARRSLVRTPCQQLTGRRLLSTGGWS